MSTPISGFMLRLELQVLHCPIDGQTMAYVKVPKYPEYIAEVQCMRCGATFRVDSPVLFAERIKDRPIS